MEKNIGNAPLGRKRREDKERKKQYMWQDHKKHSKKDKGEV